MENPIIILGANALGKTALDIFQLNDILIYCFLDEDESLHNQEIFEIAVMGSPSDDGFLKYIGKKCDAFVAATDAQERRQWVELLSKRRKVVPVNAIHPKAIVAQHAQVGEGNLVEAGVVLGTDTSVGNHTLIRANATLAAECRIADYVTIGANCSIGERVEIGEQTLIGAGAIVMPGVKIGSHAQVAPGSLVMQNVDDEQTVFGSPAKAV